MITPAYVRVLRRVNFKGGGGSSGDNYDAAYNARMATIAEAQQGMAEEYFQFWQSDYKPMEQAQIAANQKMIPHETALQIQKMQAEKGLIPKQTALAGAQMDSALSLLPGQTELGQQQIGFQQAQISDSLQAMGERAPVRSQFYQQAAEGVDIDGMVNRASADAMHSFANSQQQLGRNMARMGVNPNSGRFAALSNQNSLNQAKAVAGAKTQARVQGEEQNFNRLTTAMGYGG